jgi:hypothetical protein
MIEWEKGRSSRFAALERLGICGWCARAQRRGDVIAQLDTDLTAEHSLATHQGDAFSAGDALLTIQVLDPRAIATPSDPPQPSLLEPHSVYSRPESHTRYPRPERAMNPHISLPRPTGGPSNFGSTAASSRRNEIRMPRFFKRLFKFPQMDFEMAIWEIMSLIIAPKKVFRQIYYHVWNPVLAICSC